MFRSIFVACLWGAIALSALAVAQEEGPLLLPPGGNGDVDVPENSVGDDRSGDVIPPAPNEREDAPRTFETAPPPTTNLPASEPRRESRSDAMPVDPEIQRIANWYRTLFDRELSASERRDWRTYLDQKVGKPGDIPALLLGGQEFFDRSGGRYETWLVRVGEAIGKPVDGRELQRWYGEYRRERDRIAFTQRFLNARGPVTIEGENRETIQVAGYQPTAPRPEDAGRFQEMPDDWRGSGQGGFYNDRAGSVEDRWHLSPFSPYDDERGMAPPPSYQDHGVSPGGYGRPHFEPGHWEHHGDWRGRFRPGDPHAGHDHGGGRPPLVGQPVPQSEAALIAGWYRTYFGRDIAQWELRKWLSDLEKGVPLGEVFASVLASKEWIDRNGGNPRRWVAATLAALGQPSPQAAEAWYGRFRELDGDKLALTKEMVQRFGVQPRGPITGGPRGGGHAHAHDHDEHAHEDHREHAHEHDDDHDDDRERRRERRERRFDDDD